MIIYKAGDLFSDLKPNTLLVHVCNNKGGWGAGFTGALSKWHTQPEKAYRATRWESDSVTYIETEDSIWVANMIAQYGYKTKYNPVPL